MKKSLYRRRVSARLPACTTPVARQIIQGHRLSVSSSGTSYAHVRVHTHTHARALFLNDQALQLPDFAHAQVFALYDVAGSPEALVWLDPHEKATFPSGLYSCTHAGVELLCNLTGPFERVSVRGGVAIKGMSTSVHEPVPRAYFSWGSEISGSVSRDLGRTALLDIRQLSASDVSVVRQVAEGYEHFVFSPLVRPVQPPRRLPRVSDRVVVVPLGAGWWDVFCHERGYTSSLPNHTQRSECLEQMWPSPDRSFVMVMETGPNINTRRLVQVFPDGRRVVWCEGEFSPLGDGHVAFPGSGSVVACLLRGNTYYLMQAVGDLIPLTLEEGARVMGVFGSPHAADYVLHVRTPQMDYMISNTGARVEAQVIWDVYAHAGSVRYSAWKGVDMWHGTIPLALDE